MSHHRMCASPFFAPRLTVAVLVIRGVAPAVARLVPAAAGYWWISEDPTWDGVHAALCCVMMWHVRAGVAAAQREHRAQFRQQKGLLSKAKEKDV